MENKKNIILKESYNPIYMLDYNNFIKEVNKYKKTYKTNLKIGVSSELTSKLFTYNMMLMDEVYTLESGGCDAVDVYNGLKEFFTYNPIEPATAILIYSDEEEGIPLF